MKELQKHLLPNETCIRINAHGCTTTEAHRLAKRDLRDALNKYGQRFGSVTYESPNPALLSLKSSGQALDSGLFHYSLTSNVGNDITQAADQEQCIHVFQVASQVNASEASNVFTPEPGSAMDHSEEDRSQGPAAERTNPFLFEFVNAYLGNGGYCMFAEVFRSGLLENIKHGYLMPAPICLDEMNRQLEDKKNAQNFEQPCLHSPVGQGVYLMLSAAPAIGYSDALMKAKEEESKSLEKFQYLVLNTNYATQLTKIISLAKQNPDKVIVYHPCLVGLGYFENDPICVGTGFKDAAYAFESTCKKLNISNVKVQLDLFSKDGQLSEKQKSFVKIVGLERGERFGEPVVSSQEIARGRGYSSCYNQ